MEGREREQAILEEFHKAQQHMPDYLLRTLWPQIVASTRKDLFFRKVCAPASLCGICVFPFPPFLLQSTKVWQTQHARMRNCTYGRMHVKAEERRQCVCFRPGAICLRHV